MTTDKFNSLHLESACYKDIKHHYKKNFTSLPINIKLYNYYKLYKDYININILNNLENLLEIKIKN